MHKEYYCIPDETAKLIMDTKKAGHRVIAVGTTSIRTLESAATAKNEIAGKSGWTGIFIYPGYDFKIVDAIITNFHLPKSTLIMLISAFAGRKFVLQAYKTAVEMKYRFSRLATPCSFVASSPMRSARKNSRSSRNSTVSARLREKHNLRYDSERAACHRNMRLFFV